MKKNGIYPFQVDKFLECTVYLGDAGDDIYKVYFVAPDKSFVKVELKIDFQPQINNLKFGKPDPAAVKSIRETYPPPLSPFQAAERLKACTYSLIPIKPDLETLNFVLSVLE